MPCGGLVLVAISGSASLTLFALQCILWREQLKYRDPSDAMTVLPFAGALGAFALAAVGRRLTRQHSGPEPKRGEPKRGRRDADRFTG